MADITSLLGASSTSSSNQTASDLLVQAYKQAQQTRVDTLTNRQKTLETRRSFFSSLNTKLNSLVSNLDTFTADNADSKFVTRSITSSLSSVLTATASSDALVGINQIFVERLATNDTLIAKQLNLSSAFGESAGTKSIGLTVNGTSFNINVEFTGSETNEEAMTKIANAINSTEDIKVSAALIKNTSTTGRLTLTSKETGGENKITFTDNSVFAKLGFDTSTLNPDSTGRTVATDTEAGYRTADFNTLDSKLNVNGINVTRSSNSIDDLLAGVTLNLVKPQETGDQPVTLTTAVNSKAVEDLINPLIKNFNDLLAYLRDNKTQQRADTSISSLYSNLRGILSQSVSGLPDGNPKYLTDIGLKIGTDGTLSIGDSTKLEKLLKDDPQKVADIFTSSDGFVAKINNLIKNLTGDSGLIKSRTLSLNDQIESTKDQKVQLEDRIDRQAETLRKEYESMLRVFLQAQNQYSLLSTFSTTSTTG